MYGFQLHEPWSTYTIKPWKLLFELYLNLKYAWQRVVRGWDDSVCWDIHNHLSEFMPQWIAEIKKVNRGYPAHIAYDDCDEECRSNVFMSSHAMVGENEQDDPLLKRWHQILDEISDGFTAAHHIAGHHYPADDELFEEFHRRYPNEDFLLFGDKGARINPKWEELEKELNTDEKIKKQEAEARERFNRGMDLFRKHYFDLWD